MPTTRSEVAANSRNALLHVATVLLPVKPGDPTFRRFVDDFDWQIPGDIASTISEQETYDQIAYEYSDDSNEIVETYLTRFELSMLRQFCRFYTYQEYLTGGLTLDEWEAVTREQFDAFRTTRLGSFPRDHWYNLMGDTESFGTQENSVNQLNNTNPNVTNPLVEFKKSVKRDKAQYDVLTDDADWDAWKPEFLVQAHSHGLDNVLNPDYSPDPANSNAVALFNEQNKFAMTVFTRVLKTNSTRTIVREHLRDMNAQAIYRKLLKLMNASTQAKVQYGKLLKSLTTLQFTSESEQTAYDFILYWNDQARQLNELAPENQKLSDDLLRQLLMNAVDAISDLRDVQRNVEMREAEEGSESERFKYDLYKRLLLNAASQYDNARIKAYERNQKRSINSRQLFDSSDYDYGNSPLPSLNLSNQTRSTPRTGGICQGMAQPCTPQTVVLTRKYGMRCKISSKEQNRGVP